MSGCCGKCQCGAGEPLVLHVEGMTCQHCVMAVKKAVSAIPGVKAVEVDLEKKTVTVSCDDREVSVDAINEAVTKAGYTVVA
jgi:copper ion binding protein